MTVVLVDGSNVAHAANVEPNEVLGRVQDWASRTGSRAVLVFDGAPLLSGTDHPLVEVVASLGEDGDTVLERRAASLRRARTKHWLVTSDAELRTVAGVGADRLIRADDFLHELRDEAEADAGSVTTELLPGTQLAASLDDATRARLERMRRGE